MADAEPFLVAAAKAMEIDTLHQIDTGLDPVTAEREQWDDGNNTLAIAPRVAVAYERNHETNARLEEAGIEVVRIAGSELGSGRGGPRCMSCPVAREPAPRRLSGRQDEDPAAVDGGGDNDRAARHYVAEPVPDKLTMPATDVIASLRPVRAQRSVT